jgi:hypothetical protein
LSETLINERGPCCRPGVFTVIVIGASDAASSADLRSASIVEKKPINPYLSCSKNLLLFVRVVSPFIFFLEVRVTFIRGSFIHHHHVLLRKWLSDEPDLAVAKGTLHLKNTASFTTLLI